MQRIQQQGLPNFYGPQRFGHDGETLHLGLALLHDQPPPVSTGRSPAESAQSRFCASWPCRRCSRPCSTSILPAAWPTACCARVLPGDVMAKWPFGGMFVAEDVAAEQARFDRREIVSAGPIFGRKTFPAKDEAAEREAAVLAEAGLSARIVRPIRQAAHGQPPAQSGLRRRPDRRRCSWTHVQLTFTLPAGSYATVLLRRSYEDPTGGRRAGRRGLTPALKTPGIPGKGRKLRQLARSAVPVVTIITIILFQFLCAQLRELRLDLSAQGRCATIAREGHAAERRRASRH